MYAGDLVATGDAEARRRTIEGFDEWAVVKDRKVFYRMGVILLATILGFAFAQTLGVGLDFVAFMGAVAALILSGENADEAIKKVNWSVIIFFVGLFVVIGAVQASGLLDVMASQLVALSGGSQLALILLIACFVQGMSGVVDNIPVAATMIPVVRALEEQGLAVAPLWWVLIFTCNLGGNSTPVGSISTILAMSALEKERGVKITWGEFLKVGGAVFAVQTVAVFGYIVLFHVFDLFPGA
jgi:Na+/H+ antiporter NhaD/arsenite permease-like protein